MKKHFCLALSVLALAIFSPRAAQAVPQSFSDLTVNGAATLDNVNPAATLVIDGTYATTDSLTLSATGVVKLSQGPPNGPDGPDGSAFNAAGVTVQPVNSIFGQEGNIGQGEYFQYPGGYASEGQGPPDYGALLVSTSPTFTNGDVLHQLFDPTTNGGGSTSAGSDVFFSGTVGSLGLGELTNGETLYFRVLDTNDDDISGSYSLSGVIDGAPEVNADSAVAPVAFSLALLGLLASKRRYSNRV